MFILLLSSIADLSWNETLLQMICIKLLNNTYYWLDWLPTTTAIRWAQRAKIINYLPLPLITHFVPPHIHLSTKATTSQQISSSVLIQNPKTYLQVNHLPSPTLIDPFQASSILPWGWVWMWVWVVGWLRGWQ